MNKRDQQALTEALRFAQSAKKKSGSGGAESPI